MSAEQLGYPTQKPLALLERIISAGSNEGDVVLDPFCGCGTTIAAAQKLGRRWIGIDVTHLSIALQKYRLTQMFPDAVFEVIGEPTTEQGARQLARDDRFQFQWWALSLIRARPPRRRRGQEEGQEGRRPGHRRADHLHRRGRREGQAVIVQVKSGKVRAATSAIWWARWSARGGAGRLPVAGAADGEMTCEAVAAGFYQSPVGAMTHPRLQILTVGDLLAGRARVDMPPTGADILAAGRVGTTAGPGSRACSIDSNDE